MLRLLCLLGLVLCLATPTLAARIEVDPSSILLSQIDFTFSFELVLTDVTGLNDTGDWLQDNVIGFDIGVRLTDVCGNNHPGLFIDDALMQKSAATWQAETAGDYMFAPFGIGGTDSNAVTTSSVLSDVHGVSLLTCNILDQRTVSGPPPPAKGVKPRVGQVVAKFVVWWDTTPIGYDNWIRIEIQGGSLASPDPFFLTNAEGGGPIFLEAVGIEPPEPGTMSLLALGLGGVIARKGRRRS